MSWDILIDEDALAALLPTAYARIARPVKEGLVVFLSGLPTSVQQSILAEQAGLPLATSLSQRLGLLALRCPVLHKLGQVLARDQRLAEELRRELRPLESLPPTMAIDAIRRILADELGPLESLRLTLGRQALAEASVAVVISFESDDGNLPRHGVFKLLRPGIEERLEMELALLGRVGSHLDERCAELAIPQLDYQDVFEQVRDKLRSEVRLDQEQQHLVEAAKIYVDNRDVQIPRLLEHCTPRVTAMERVYGQKVTEHQLTSAVDRRRLAGVITRAILAQPVFTRQELALFHGDPHAGNLLYTRDGRLAILDWSLAGHLDDRERVAIGQIMLAAISFDARRIVGVLNQLDTRRQLIQSKLREVVDDWLRKIRRGLLPGLSWFVGLLDEATQSARLRLGTNLVLFRKSLLSVEGVIHDLRADEFRLDDAFLCEAVLAFGSDLPGRWLSPPSSRAFATRLSNWDLTATILGGPLAIARFWRAEYSDILRGRNLLISRKS